MNWLNVHTGERREGMPPEMDALMRELTAETVKEITPEAMRCKHNGITPDEFASDILSGAESGHDSDRHSWQSFLALQSVYDAVAEVVSAVWGVECSVNIVQRSPGR